MKKVLVVLVVMLLAVSAHAAQKEFVENGGFDSGTTGWFFDKSGDSPGHIQYGIIGYGPHGPGNNQEQYGASEPFLGFSTGGQENFNLWAYQVVTNLVIGETYNFSAIFGGGNCDAQAGQPDTFCWWEVGLFAGGYSWNTVEIGAGNPANLVGGKVLAYDKFGWDLASTSFVATDTTYTIYLKSGRSNSNWQYYATYFDNVSLIGEDGIIEPVPEPSSILALGAGLMGMAGFAVRHRK